MTMLRAVAVIASWRVADLATTLFALAHGAREANPLAAATLAAGGIGGLFVLTAFGMASQSAGVFLLSPRFRRVALGIITTVSAVIVASNLAVIAGLRY